MLQVQKWPFFKLFFKGSIGQEIVFYDVLERKNAFLGYKNKKFKNSKNWHFSKGVKPWFWSKNGHFSNFFFLVIEARKMSFTILQNTKTPFQAIKLRSSKSRKNDIFFKGVNPWFLSIKCHFFNFFFQSVYAWKTCFTIFWSKKTPFQVIKRRSLKTRKIDIFPKGLTQGVGPKMAIFSTFFFRQYRPGKCLLLRYSRTKKTPFQPIKTRR